MFLVDNYPRAAEKNCNEFISYNLNREMFLDAHELWF